MAVIFIILQARKKRLMFGLSSITPLSFLTNYNPTIPASLVERIWRWIELVLQVAMDLFGQPKDGWLGL